jgi:hypothetical protein
MGTVAEVSRRALLAVAALTVAMVLPASVFAASPDPAVATNAAVAGADDSLISASVDIARLLTVVGVPTTPTAR